MICRSGVREAALFVTRAAATNFNHHDIAQRETPFSSPRPPRSPALDRQHCNHRSANAPGDYIYLAFTDRFLRPEHTKGLRFVKAFLSPTTDSGRNLPPIPIKPVCHLLSGYLDRILFRPLDQLRTPPAVGPFTNRWIDVVLGCPSLSSSLSSVSCAA